MVYEITLIKCGRTKTMTINEVTSKDEAILKAMTITEEDGFTFSKAVLIDSRTQA